MYQKLQYSEQSPTPLRVLREGVSHTAVIGWLLVFVLFEWLRAKIGIYGFQWTEATALPSISALECCELYFLTKMLNRQELKRRASRPDAFATFIAIAGVVFLIDGKPFIAATILSLFMLIRSFWTRDSRLIAFGVFVFLSQYNPLLGAFGVLHNFVGSIDAFFLRNALNSAGYEVTGARSIIFNPSTNFGIDILSGCASSYPVIIVMTGFVLTVLGFRKRFHMTDIVFGAGLIVATVLVNLTRLAPAALSREGYTYWHGGEGAAIVAAAYALLAVGCGYWASHYARAPGETR